ncbi:MAG: hypothetical protein U0326_15325 [Polyangiales bacterium]
MGFGLRELAARDVPGIHRRRIWTRAQRVERLIEHGRQQRVVRLVVRHVLRHDELAVGDDLGVVVQAQLRLVVALHHARFGLARVQVVGAMRVQLRQRLLDHLLARVGRRQLLGQVLAGAMLGLVEGFELREDLLDRLVAVRVEELQEALAMERRVHRADGAELGAIEGVQDHVDQARVGGDAGDVASERAKGVPMRVEEAVQRVVIGALHAGEPHQLDALAAGDLHLSQGAYVPEVTVEPDPQEQLAAPRRPPSRVGGRVDEAHRTEVHRVEQIIEEARGVIGPD